MRRAFTLIELLAVIVLIAMGAAVLGAGLARSSDASELRRAEGTIRDFDRRARLAATREHDVRLTIEAGEDQTTLRLIAADSSQLASADLRSRLSISIDDAPTDTVRYRSTGRSPDYRVTIENTARTAAFDVAGLTGWIEPAGGDR